MSASGNEIRQDERSLQPTVILLSVAVIMVFQWYFGRMGFFRRELAGLFPDTWLTPLYPFIYVSVSSVVLRGLVPAMLVLGVLRGSLRDFGILTRGRAGGWWPYLLLYLAMLPVILIAAQMDTFLQQYPRCGPIIDGPSIPLRGFVVYQAFYLLIFISGEAFWRGYVLFGLRPRFGSYAILIMVIPYTMQHFGKPFPEAMGAIVAGTVLGWLALRRGNFWLGAALHYAIALTMDLTALVCRGLALSLS